MRFSLKSKNRTEVEKTVTKLTVFKNQTIFGFSKNLSFFSDYGTDVWFFLCLVRYYFVWYEQTRFLKKRLSLFLTKYNKEKIYIFFSENRPLKYETIFFIIFSKLYFVWYEQKLFWNKVFSFFLPKRIKKLI